jgi:hypothetical protein
LLLSQKGHDEHVALISHDRTEKQQASLYISHDNGATWTATLHSAFRPIYVAADASDQLFVVFLYDDYPEVCQSTDLGSSWMWVKSVSTLPPMNRNAPFTFHWNHEDLSRLIVDGAGNLYLRGHRSTDRGYHWAACYPFYYCDEVYHWEDELVVGPDRVLYAADHTTILISSDDGNSWTTRSLPLKTGEHISCLSVDETSVLYAGTGKAGMLISKDAGLTWTRKQLATDWEHSTATIAASGNGTVLASLGYPDYSRAALLRSRDHGDTWEVLYSNLE